MSSLNTKGPGGLSQPVLGALGLVFVTVAIFLLGIVPGKATALTTIITAITFGLPVLIVLTLWWNGWPFRSLPRVSAGWSRFAFLAVATFLLTAIGQAITGKLDISGIFGAEGAFGIFPYGFVLAASVFVATLQFTFVTGKAPFEKMSEVGSGIAVFVSAWVLGLLQYFFLLNWEEGAGRPPAPPIAGFGPIYALDWPAVLLSIVVVQMVFFLLLKGFPFAKVTQPTLRFVVVNVFSIGGGILLHEGLKLIGMNGNQISALAGAITAAVIIIEILFGGWPFGARITAGAQIGRIVLAAGITAVLMTVLLAVGSINYPTDPGTPPVELWVAGVCLNLIAGFAIVHVAVFDRWPLRDGTPAMSPEVPEVIESERMEVKP